MKTHKSTIKVSAVVLVLLFSIFLLYTTLTGSDFPRALYGPPPVGNGNAWQDFANLNPNQVWHYWGYGNSINLSAYFDVLGGYGMKSALRDLYYWTPTHNPYLVENYSWGQWDRWEVEMDHDEAYDSLLTHGNGWCFFDQNIGVPVEIPPSEGGGIAWNVLVSTDNAGAILSGPMFTSSNTRFGWRVPNFKYPPKAYTGIDSQLFQFRIRTKAQYTNIDTNTTVFVANLWHFNEGSEPLTPDPPANEEYNDSTFAGSFIVQVRDFTGSNQWNLFTLTDTVRAPLYGSRLDFYWPDSVNLWIDWVDYYDMDRGRFIAVDSLRNATLDSIVYECQDLENTYGDTIALWAQSDEPWQTQWRIHKYINTALLAANVLPTLTPFYEGGFGAQVKGFAWTSRPQIIEIEHYPFGSNSALIQTELSAIAAKVDSAYVGAHLYIPNAELRFLGQVKGEKHKTGSIWDWTMRNPNRAEIMAESFIALAHGAKGINFFLYPSNVSYDTANNPIDSSFGLVNLNYEHPSGSIYDEKWQAVREVYTQIDSIGNTLLSLQRDAAYCCANPNYQSPVTDIYFTEESGDTIEVGQFHDSSDANYLIIVNRKTDADRHITVEINYAGIWALRDLYTQERFITTTGNFKGIPFEAGEGRVFKVEAFTNTTWTNDDHIVLADTVEIPTRLMLWTTITAGTTIKATASGMLQTGYNAQLDCNGTADDSVIFTALDSSQGWKGIYGLARGIDSLNYTQIEHVSGAQAIKMRSNRTVHINRCNISQNEGLALDCADAKIVAEYSNFNDNEGSCAVSYSNVDGHFYYCNINNNDGCGIFMQNSSTPWFGHSQISENGNTGIICYGVGTDPILCGGTTIGHNIIVDNAIDGIASCNGALPELGRSSPGNNSIHGNGVGSTGYDLMNTSSDTVYARYNWWGGTPQDSQFYGKVSYVPWLDDEPDSFVSPPPEQKKKGSGGPADPGVNTQDAYRLNNVAMELLLNGFYYTAIDTFKLVINTYPNTDPGRFALDHLVLAYKEADNYQGAITYLSGIISNPPDPSLVPRAYYHKTLLLVRTGEFLPALAIASNMQMISVWPANLLEPTLIELGMIYKYGLNNIASGDSVFQQFLNQHPESPLASLAALELGIPWEGRGGMSGGMTGTAQIDDGLPDRFALYPAFPNPFNPATIIRFDLPKPAKVVLSIYEVSGRLVTTSVNGWREAGAHEVTFDGSDLASGVYIYQIKAGEYTASEKMVLLK